ncbi:hypothetical protein scyTo_0011502 [Scyliorhinus torazame]|uniref:RRM domain-containing protein n=1 Tax=Scyliorhinus torazame TaxID=75743 RepID=A0A401NP92_SCYTO|nr:hypothetical protein [Scyliorhinus torazame]
MTQLNDYEHRQAYMPEEGCRGGKVQDSARIFKLRAKDVNSVHGNQDPVQVGKVNAGTGFGQLYDAHVEIYGDSNSGGQEDCVDDAEKQSVPHNIFNFCIKPLSWQVVMFDPAFLDRYGKIVSTKAILDKTTNKCKGYGFVDFDSPAAAQKAVAALKGNGVQAQMAKQQEQDPTNLYISNLPPSVDEQELENMLKPYGQVISTRILRDANGTSRGVGFARMESTEKCEAVITHFNGKFIKTPPGVPGKF